MSELPALRFPAGSLFPMPNGAYYRTATGEIVLNCDRLQLAAALEVAKAIGIDQPRAVAPATDTDSVLRRYDQFGDPWLIRTHTPPPGETE